MLYIYKYVLMRPKQIIHRFKCGLHQTSCDMFPQIGTNKLMAVIISIVHCPMRHERRALMGRGRLQKRPERFRRWGGERSNNTMDS